MPLNWSKNLSNNQLKDMEFASAFAAKLKKNEISDFISRFKCKNDSYLMRVKRFDNLYSLVLIINSQDDVFEYCKVNHIEILKVKIPKFKPLSKSQYISTMENWPVNKYTEVDQNYIEENVKVVLEEYTNALLLNSNNRIYNPKCLCSGFCAIFDKKSTVPIKLKFDDDSDILFGHSILSAVSYVSMNYKDTYLCTSLFCLLGREPCVSCAMALVHGRINDVFILNKSISKYKTYSEEKFNFNSNINHRYGVYFLENCE